MTVAAVSFFIYIVAGVTKSWVISLPVGIAVMIGVLFVIRSMTGGKRQPQKA